ALRDQRELGSAAWGRDGRGQPGRAGRCADPGRPRPPRFFRPKLRPPFYAPAPCPAGAGPPTPAAPQRRRAAAGCPILRVTGAPDLVSCGGEIWETLLVRCLPFLQQG